MSGTTTQTTGLSRADVLRVAASSETDPRTVLAYLDGRSVRRASANAISAALREIGRSSLVRCPECDYERKHGKVGPYDSHTCDPDANTEAA